MKIILIPLLGMLTSSVFSAPAESPVEDWELYYSIGGGEAIRAPTGDIINTYSLSLGGGNISYSCGKFDLDASFGNIIGDISAGIDGVTNQLTEAAGAAIASLPMLLIQKANPGLYEFLNQSKEQAQAAISLSTKSCEELEASMAGQNPYQDLVSVGIGNEWRRFGVNDNGNIVEAKKKAESSSDKEIDWVCGKAGKTQDIKTTGDIVMTGYNVLQGRDACATGGISGGTHISEIFPTTEDVKEWVVEVVGETSINLNDGANDSAKVESKPGAGLLPEKEKVQEEVINELETLVGDCCRFEDLQKVQAPGMAMGLDVIEAIKLVDIGTQGIIIHRLAEEIAISRTTAKAMLAQRIFRTGMRHPAVAALPESVKIEIRYSIDELTYEVNSLHLAGKIHSDIGLKTIKLLLAHKATAESTGLRDLPPAPKTELPLRGGVQKK
jgi:integrating conjugative element protein (TIGR03755 family)